MKPLMMMRTKGITGPAFAKHAGVRGLSKSAGDFIGAGEAPYAGLRPIRGWTALEGCVVGTGSQVTIRFSGEVTFTEHDSVVITNRTTGEIRPAVTSLSVSPSDVITYEVPWVNPPAIGDVIEYSYSDIKLLWVNNIYGHISTFKRMRNFTIKIKFTPRVFGSNQAFISEEGAGARLMWSNTDTFRWVFGGQNYDFIQTTDMYDGKEHTIEMTSNNDTGDLTWLLDGTESFVTPNINTGDTDFYGIGLRWDTLGTFLVSNMSYLALIDHDDPSNSVEWNFTCNCIDRQPAVIPDVDTDIVWGSIAQENWLVGDYVDGESEPMRDAVLVATNCEG